MTISGTNKSLPVAPRSKGCITCISRKKRCDGRRPTCQACEDRKQICRGYRRQDIVFLSDGWRAPGVSAGERKASTPAKAGPPVTLSSSASRSVGAPCHSASNLISLHKTPAIDRSTLQVNYFISGFASRPFRAPPYINDLFQLYFSPLRTQQSHGAKYGQSLDAPVVLAVDALAQGHFGIAKADSVSVQQSFHKYGMALRSMSAIMIELGLDSSDPPCISEGEWQHLAFFCVVMAFWEFKMSPKSHNWQKHICGLSRAIAMRGRNHKYSDANVKLIVGSRLLIILQALSSRQPVCFLTHKQQHKSPVSPAGLDVAAGVVDPCQDSAFPIDKNFYSLVDSITNIVTDLVVTMAEYDQLLIRSPSTIPEADVDFGKTLKVLYERAQTTLSRLDAVIGTVDPLMSEVPLNSYLSAHKVITGDPVLDDQFWTIAGRDIQTLFDKILSFPSMADCHTATLFWTAAMSLHIFIIDMLTVASSLNLNLTGANDLSEQIKKHRFRLMVYIRQVLQSIIFFELEENRKLSPFFLAVAFQMSEVVLERESEALRSEGAKDAEINECGKLQELTSRYITWATQTKIAIKMDINIPQRRTARPSKMV